MTIDTYILEKGKPGRRFQEEKGLLSETNSCLQNKCQSLRYLKK
jgi:hypothetical protein